MQKHLILLAGGVGQRLWPLSTTDMPKQFLKNQNNLSLFQQTIERNKGLFDRIIILSQEKYFFFIIDQLSLIDNHNLQIYLEPVGKGTLPILILSLLDLELNDFFFLTPSDHEILNRELYKDDLSKNLFTKIQNDLVLVGKKPTCPNINFGYILHKDQKVIRFIEKPGLNQAELLIKQPNTLWNCGMLFAKVSDFLNIIKRLEPALYQSCVKIHNSKNNETLKYKVTRYQSKEFFNLITLNIDKTILEKITNLKVIEARFDWKDCGSIDAYLKFTNQLENLTLLNSNNITINGVKQRVVVQNANDLAIIEKDNNLFVIKI